MFTVRIMNWMVAVKVARITNGAEFGHWIATQTNRLIKPYIPYDHGDLTRSARIGPYRVAWKTPYARYVYKGTRLHFQRHQHPLATHHWIDAFRASEGVGKLARSATRKLKGGLS